VVEEGPVGAPINREGEAKSKGGKRSENEGTKSGFPKELGAKGGIKKSRKEASRPAEGCRKGRGNAKKARSIERSAIEGIGDGLKAFKTTKKTASGIKLTACAPGKRSQSGVGYQENRSTRFIEKQLKTYRREPRNRKRRQQGGRCDAKLLNWPS